MTTTDSPSRRALPDLPARTRSYHNHHLDSSMWDDVQPRPDDIIIDTAYKSGTTWTQQIVAMLLFQGEDPPEPLSVISPWVDMRLPPREEKIPAIEAQTHRRFLKSHLPLDGLRFFPECKYIYVGRDGRDVFMSLFNHYRSGNALWYELVNESPGRVGPPIPRCPEDPRAMWRDWLSKGWFAWEQDGFPFWSLFRHVQSWWRYRHLPSILMLHYENLKRDLPGEMRRIAGFLDIEIDEARFPTMVEKCSFSYMKTNAGRMLPQMEERLDGGASSFIHKGTGGRWRDVLTEDDLARYDAVVAERLTPDCAHWLATGELPG